MDNEHGDTTRTFEGALPRQSRVHYVFQLYVAGTTARSLQAVERIKRLCERHLTGRYDLEVVDIYQVPAQAEEHDIVAAPTLVKRRPEPLRRMVGSMTDESRLLRAIGVATS
ncbi:MAG TPA: circadian clock KaiB family protein [Gemmatimonadaceae bacterium]|nr:circadian clock KaiB family protein [Gemmatimonadaceae bacterium]